MHEHERLSADIGKAIVHTEINQIIQTSKVPSDYSDFQGSANTCIWVRVVPHRTPKNS